MPYQRRTRRNLRRHIISWQDLNRANSQVTDELWNLGLWNSRLNKVDVYWVSASLKYYGWCTDHIFMPAISGAQLADLAHGRHIRLVDVLRHEWGHAVAHHHTELFDTSRFVRIFGAPYESEEPVWDYSPQDHLTQYSATMPCEDFAEVFHYFIRHKGRLPLRLHNKPAIVRKWEFVEWLATKVSKI